MKLKLKLKYFLHVLALGGCVSTQIDGPQHMGPDSENSMRAPYNFTVSKEVARWGETSQRFEVRHGDCGEYDCNNDRRRHELIEPRSSANSMVGQANWYGWSVYLPEDFQDLSPTNTTLGQVKLYSWRGPLWNFNIRGNALVFQYRSSGSYDSIDCATIPLSQMRGRWTDIVVYSDHRYERSGSSPMTEVWINGKSMCRNYSPLVTPKMVDVAGTDRIFLRYGIYNSYVSRWLNANKTLPVSVPGFSDYHEDSGGTSVSFARRSFDLDWGVELPTQVAFFDEVAIGKTREEVDVRLKRSE